jgi:hypothetical protein
MNKPAIDMLKIGLTALKKQRKKEEKWQNAFNEMFDGHFVPQYSYALEDAIVRMLELIYRDEYQTISWWIYEQDFGQKCKDAPALWLEDKTPVNLRNIYELYDYLITQNFKEESKLDDIKYNQPKKESSDKEQEINLVDILCSAIENITKDSVKKVEEKNKAYKKSNDIDLDILNDGRTRVIYGNIDIKSVGDIINSLLDK